MSTQYFEDLTVGDTYESRGRTVTKTQIIEFATAFDPQPFHIDEEAARDTMFDGIIASGIHTFGICQRLATEAFYANIAFVVGRGADGLRFQNPTYPDDTLSVEVTVVEKQPHEERADMGEAKVDIRGYNQHGDEAARWTAVILVERREGD